MVKRTGSATQFKYVVKRPSFIRFVPAANDRTPQPSLHRLIAMPEAAALLTRLRCFGVGCVPAAHDRRVSLSYPTDRLVPPGLIAEARRMEAALAELLVVPPSLPTGRAVPRTDSEGDRPVAYAFDSGFGSSGPWLNWHARPSNDGAIVAGSWSLRDKDGRAQTNIPQRGMVIDFTRLRTGWELSGGMSGVPPERRWNADRAYYESRPSDDWKRCLSVSVALGTDICVTWEQSGVGAMAGLNDLVRRIAVDLEVALQAAKLPIVRSTGVRSITTRGGGTAAPVFEVLRWIDRPAILDAVAVDDTDDDPLPDSGPVPGDGPLPRPSSPPPLPPLADDPGVADEAAYGGVDPFGDDSWTQQPVLPVPAQVTPMPTAQPAPARKDKTRNVGASAAAKATALRGTPSTAAPVKVSGRDKLREWHNARRAEPPTPGLSDEQVGDGF